MRLFLVESRAPACSPFACVNTERILPANSPGQTPESRNTRINTREEEERGNVKESGIGGRRRGGESFRRFEPLTDLFGREREREGGGERQRKKRRKEGGEGRGRVFWRKTGRVASRFKSTHVCLSSRNSSFLRSCKREKGRCGQVNDPLSRGWRGLATAETGWPSIAMQAGKKSKRRNPRGAANREHLPVFTSQRTCVPRPNTGTGT